MTSEDSDQEVSDTLMNWPVTDLALRSAILTAFRRHQISTVDDLVSMSPRKRYFIAGIGIKGWAEICEQLEAIGVFIENPKPSP